MKILSLEHSIGEIISHRLFGHDFYRDPTEGKHDREQEIDNFLQQSQIEKVTKLENGYECRICEATDYDLVDYKAYCKCGEIIRYDSMLGLNVKVDEHLQEVNRESCNTCGKVFTGDNAAQKVGGHSRTHDESSA